MYIFKLDLVSTINFLIPSGTTFSPLIFFFPNSICAFTYSHWASQREAIMLTNVSVRIIKSKLFEISWKALIVIVFESSFYLYTVGAVFLFKYGLIIRDDKYIWEIYMQCILEICHEIWCVMCKTINHLLLFEFNNGFISHLMNKHRNAIIRLWLQYF